MTTWAGTIRHPWFSPPTAKRRLSNDDDDDDDDDNASFASSRRKRVKYSSLEHTLAHMSLGTLVATGDVDMWPTRPRMQEVLVPSAVEEPDTPTSDTVDMDVEPIESGQLDIREVQISRAALECIKRQTHRPPIVPLPPQTPHSQALVLYRAPRPPMSEYTCDERVIPPIVVAQEEDVMEVE